MRQSTYMLGIGMVLVLMASSVKAAGVSYEVKMSVPYTHEFEVTMVTKGLKSDHVDFIMPVWTPGSYLVREFARNVSGFSAATADGRALRWQKINKNTWRVDAKNAPEIVVAYKVYAYEISVRTSFLDDSHGYINPASVFMYVDALKDEPLELTIRPYEGWKQISTGLERSSVENNRFVAPNYDVLVDSPIEVGNQEVHEFEVEGVPHHVSIYGKGNFDAPKLVEGMRKIVQQAAEMFGGLPYRQYTFLVQMLPRGGGGLEHANSASLQSSAFRFGRDGTSKGFYGLTAHEFFHAWNVKRIRPRALGPFDYTKENYTSLLWVAEGFTSYYGPVLLRRAGIYSTKDFLDSQAGRIRDLQRTPGRLFQSVSDASFDAWIKYYRRDENSINSQVSYYTKGAVLGMLLDLEIRHSTHNEKSLDDLMRYVFVEYAQRKGRGFTQDEFQRAAEKIASEGLSGFFRDYVDGTKEIDYDAALRYAGLRLQLGERPATAEGGEKDDARAVPFLGISTSENGQLPVITTVLRDSPAYRGGLNVDDELIAFNGIRVDQQTWRDRLADHAPGDSLRITLGRRGLLREFEVVLGTAPPDDYRLEKLDEADELQKDIFESWAGEPWDEALAPTE